MQTQKRAAVWLFALIAVGAGCTSTSVPKRYPLPYVGSRVTPRVRGSAATVGISNFQDRRVGRGGVSTPVGQGDAVRTWGIESAHTPVGRGPATGTLSATQEATRPAGIDSTTSGRVGVSRSPNTVGTSSSTGPISGVDRDY